MSEFKDGSLNLPDFTPVDHARHCQQYTNIINRNDDDMVLHDEIDALQLDLETLLVAATRRMRQLVSGLHGLSDAQDAKKDKKRELDSKRTKTSEDRPNKKLKSMDSPSHAKYLPLGVPRSKAKGLNTKVLDYENVDTSVTSQQPPRVPINDAPNKFWQSIEPYCAPISQDNIEMLEKLCQENEIDEKEFYEIPALGEHYSKRWALEDLREEKSEGKRSSVKTSDKQVDNNVEGMLKKAADSIDAMDTCPFGSLTQRLISSFVDENIMLPPEHDAIESGQTVDNDANPNSASDIELVNPIKFSKSLAHTHKLETRIKMELIEQGILEPETVDSKKEDEVLVELMRSQQELKAVSSQNKDVLHQLLQVAKEERKKQEIKKKIDILNSEVIDHYRRVMAARQKKENVAEKGKRFRVEISERS